MASGGQLPQKHQAVTVKVNPRERTLIASSPQPMQEFVTQVSKNEWSPEALIEGSTEKVLRHEQLGRELIRLSLRRRSTTVAPEHRTGRVAMVSSTPVKLVVPDLVGNGEPLGPLSELRRDSDETLRAI
jgi:hypothetical protein